MCPSTRRNNKNKDMFGKATPHHIIIVRSCTLPVRTYTYVYVNRRQKLVTAALCVGLHTVGRTRTEVGFWFRSVEQAANFRKRRGSRK